VLLAIDLGSTVTKAVVWGEEGPFGVGRAALRTDHRQGGIAEQEPDDWWVALAAACREALGGPGAASQITCIVFSAARQTFVTVDAALRPTGPGIMWSDRRAGAEARSLASRLGGTEGFRRRTGMILDSAAPAAKLAWLETHRPGTLSSARWILAPRDLALARMTGEILTDATMAQSSGFYDSELRLVDPLAGRWASLFPPVVESTATVGRLSEDAASELGLPRGVPVVIGAGDRACEVIGTRAAPDMPMVSWGTTANVSVPTGAWPEGDSYEGVVSRGATGGFLLEAGLASAGSFMEWLAGIGAARSGGVDELVGLASSSPPGARGVVATGWLGGARAPWWRDDARASYFGLSPDHSLGELARAAIEAVAFDVTRCLENISRTTRVQPARVVMGGGSALALWGEILCGVTGLPAARRRSGLGALAGAAMIAASATGTDPGLGPDLGLGPDRALGGMDLDRIDPPEPDLEPDPELVETYRALRPISDAAAAATLAFAGAAASAGGPGEADRETTEAARGTGDTR
jgi:xylulokinase